MNQMNRLNRELTNKTYEKIENSLSMIRETNKIDRNTP